MEVFVARQAIFDRNLKIYGYELLFRSHLTGAFDGADASSATLQVISNSFLSIGAEKILGGGKGFVNFPQALLADDRLELLPKETTVLEILESVQPDPETLAACRRLKDKGYILALDDFVGQPGYEGLIELAEIIKVEFPQLTLVERRAICAKYGKSGTRMLAEKVETREEFQQALDMGYDYFQGYFFARPATIRKRVITGFETNYLNLLREIHKPEINRARVAELIQMEVSLVYRLLRYINSAAFRRVSRIGSISQAMAVLGDDGIRRWTWLAAAPNLARNKPGELIVNAAVRARFCELLAPVAGLASRQSDLFLMGMLSRLDALLDRPLEELLPELCLPEEVEQALLPPAPPDNRLAILFSLVRAYEAACWEPVLRYSTQLNIPPARLPDFYQQSIEWAERLYSVTSPQN